ncbi:hypothetical protein JB92DRAFT_2208304 [Gautieria morchelliformis]|nr:hypothetical protein JB92DRAFT_2208304 [Gautieria morchelliformis]
MPNPRPKTPPPPPPPAYDVNQDVILLMDAGENFPMHTQAKVQSRMSLNAPVRTHYSPMKRSDSDISFYGVNTPLTAQNASYRVGVMVRMEIDADTGLLIESSMIPHQYLSPTRDGRQHTDLFHSLNYAYLIAPWKYKHQGNEVLLRKGTKVHIWAEAHTKAAAPPQGLTGPATKSKWLKREWNKRWFKVTHIFPMHSSRALHKHTRPVKSDSACRCRYRL